MPEACKTNYGDQKKYGDVSPRNAGDKNHPKPIARNRYRRTKIRLQHDECKEKEGVEARDDDVAIVLDFDVPPAEIFCQDHDENEFRRIRRLHGKCSEAKSILASLDDH